MHVPLEWLKDYVDIGIQTSRLTELLTMSGSKVEAIHRVNSGSDVEEVIEFEITANRPDCLSIIGIAREVAATLGVNLRLPEIPDLAGNDDINDMVKISILDFEICPRYCARVIKDINIKPSPEWMQRRLTLAGIRPINNIVDITNYVMLEMGQPMHAFDLDRLSGKTILVRKAYENENIETLDGKIRSLSMDMLVIADKDKAVGIAGVMGGANSEITDTTKRILLESAKFNQTSIRLTSKALGLRSDASSRFEKGIDTQLAKKAIERAAYLIKELGAGTVVGGLIDACSEEYKERCVEVDHNKINSLLGLSLSQDQIIEILSVLGIKIKKGDGFIEAIIPSFRADIEGIADLAEEVARIYGYDKIPLTVMGTSSVRGSKTRSQKLIDLIKDIFVGADFYETITYSFTSPKVYASIGFDNPEDYPLSIAITNPLGEDQSIMRTTVIPNMLEVLARNYSRGQQNVKVFEIAKAFLPRSLPLNELPIEKGVLSVAAYGNGSDFFVFKGIIELLMREMGIDDRVSYAPYTHPSFHPGRTTIIQFSGQSLGIFGEIHPVVGSNYEMNGLRIMMAELDLDTILNEAQTYRKYVALPKYPAVKRDIAITADKKLSAESILRLIRELAGDLLTEIELFDIYEGTQIPDGYRSLAYSLSYRAADRTLRDDEVSKIHLKVTEGLEKMPGAKLRQ